MESFRSRKPTIEVALDSREVRRIHAAHGRDRVRYRELGFLVLRHGHIYQTSKTWTASTKS